MRYSPRGILRFTAGLVTAALILGASTASATSVLVWSSGNSASSTANVAAWIQALGGFDTVDGINSDSLTFAQVNSYDSVLYYSNSSTSGNTGRGDVLADFADTGKRLVLATFAWANQGGNTLQGRIVSDELSPYFYEGSSLYSNVNMIYNDGSSFFTGVNSLSGFYHDNVGLTSGAASLAYWNDGESLLAVKNNVVGVNLFPDDNYGNLGGDYRQLFVNALGANVSVPEPLTALTLGLGLLGLSLTRRQAR